VLNVCYCGLLGLANKKTVAVQPAGEKDTAVVLSTTKTKKQNNPAKLSHKSVMRKDFRKMAKAVKNQVLAPENNSSTLNPVPLLFYVWQFVVLHAMHWIVCHTLFLLVICCCDEP
jgi:hypothetical protein